MEDTILIPLLVTTLVGLLGWIVLHRFASRRDFEDKKREIVTQYLIGCYTDLCEFHCDRNDIDIDLQKLQKIFNYVQLFGSEEQNVLINKIIQSLKLGGDCDITPLIDNLRIELRQFLILKKLPHEVQFIDIKTINSTK